MRDYNVTVRSGISSPPSLEVSFHSPLSVYLNGKGRIEHVINDKGNWTSLEGGDGDVAYYCGSGEEKN